MASMASMALSPEDICGVGSSKAKSTSMTSSATADVEDPGSSNACDARVPTSPSLAGSVSSSIRTSNASSSSDASDASEPYSISGSELAALPSSSSPPVMLPTTALSGRSLDVDADVLAASALALAASAASVGADGEDEDDAALVLTLTGLAASGLRPPPSLPFDPSGGSVVEAPPILGRGPPRDASGFARVIVAGRPGGVFGDGLEKSSSSSSSSMISSSKPRSPIAPTRSVHEMGTQRNNSQLGSTRAVRAVRRDARFIFR